MIARAVQVAVALMLSASTAFAQQAAEPPPPPADHAADRVYDPGVMAAARANMHQEHGGETFSMVLVNIAEYQSLKGREAYRWEAEAWYGGDINRFVAKTEGEGTFGASSERAEFQALYSRAIDRYLNLQAGLRYDVSPKPTRAYATIGVEGLAPYVIETTAALFVSDKGDALARLEAYYDQLITQRLVLQPRVEMNLAAQDVRANDIGSGVVDIELGLRLRYELRREFAPYVGVSYERKTGRTADFARAAGEPVGGTAVVIGLHTWF